MSLIDPSGPLTAYSYEFTNTNYGHLDVRQPGPGTWTAILFTYQGGVSVPVHYDFSSSRFDTVDSVTQSAFALSAGDSRTVHVRTTASSAAGDYSRDLELTGIAGHQSVVPIVLRTLVPSRGVARLAARSREAAAPATTPLPSRTRSRSTCSRALPPSPRPSR